MDLMVANAVMAGTSGWNGSAWISETNPTEFEARANECFAFASAIAEVVTLNPADPLLGFKSAMLAAISNGVIAGRNLTSSNPADYSQIALSVKALFEASAAKLLLPPP